ncbi:hypothetical protein RHSIM_Rhsim11G0062800 [Rhododendron simsii]|uniref:CCHC-type domain-containing protein n=1 Tax=Rhododendron simsii TaxID=118357 RepID=A0A834G8D9_RHOSS|nr:hypothetical protein RHSIM_Rhsim11G0062800 [Rhododendron simsii]
MSIQEYYSGFINIWAEYKELVYANVSIEGLKTLQAVHEITQRDQFHMKLRREFEHVRSNLMSRAPTPSLETCLSELLRDEHQCLTQEALERKDIGSCPLDAAFATQAGGKDVSTKQCYSCKEFGHIANNYKKKYCNFCKKPGHLITECRHRPQNRSPNAFYATSVEGLHMVPNALLLSSHTSTTSNAMTPEVVQQMSQSAFSAFCFTAMSDIPHTLPLHNVFHTPRLASNLISVGQLVDDNCNVLFFKSGCIVQDQASGKVIGKGPKCGRMFPIGLSIYPKNKFLFSLLCSTSTPSYQMWHKRLGHPNAKKLLFMLKFGLLLNKDHVSLQDVLFHCDSCKLGKSKALPFPIHNDITTNCFDLIDSDVWGIAPVSSHSHDKYFVTFIDDYSRYT